MNESELFSFYAKNQLKNLYLSRVKILKRFLCLKEEMTDISAIFLLFYFLPPTFRRKREDNVCTLFVRPHPKRGGIPVPGSFPDLWSQVISGEYPRGVP